MNEKDFSEEKVIETLKKWKLEVRSPRNDGWVQLHYKDKIRRIFVESSRLLKEIKDC